ncbi:uromodulin-like 1 [Alosa alosa]|uniref:uromodulin-like 1 n=1 Tax=Alosa alosa TaxID=278164 RepID=UPI0020155085|nr:uromodulin-like 1 [Alosa alosa]
MGGYELSMTGYYLCAVNQTTVMSSVLSYKTPYTQRRSCGGWLPWRTCEVTLYRVAYRSHPISLHREVMQCCPGYEQVGSYCALPLNCSAEFTAKPGFCPEAWPNGSHCASQPQCGLDTDCPGWQKCCPATGGRYCADPQPPAEQGWCFNATVTVKIDYQEMIATEKGLLNHMRLLHSVVTGALNYSDMSVRHVVSWSAGPHITSSSLLIGSSWALVLADVSRRLQSLLRHIEEVVAVTVQDMDDCAHRELSKCPPHSVCINTVGSYMCSSANHSKSTTTEPPSPTTAGTVITSTLTKATGTITKTISNSPVITTLSTTNARVTNAVATATTSTPTKAMVTSTIMSPDLTTTIQVISQSVTITVVCNAGYMSVWVARDFLSGKHMSAESLYLGLPECGVNGGNNSHVELVAAWNECDTVLMSNSTHNTAEVTLYNDMSSHTWPDGSVSMPSARLQVPILCSTVMSTGLPPLVTMGQDESTSLSDPWSGSSSTTLPQMPPTPSVTSEPPHNFPCNVPEIVSIKALNITSSSFRVSWATAPPDIQALVESGKVRVVITGFSQGSVVVNFSIVFVPSEDQDIVGLSHSLMASLQKSSKYAVDSNSTSIQDLNECVSGDVDCSTEAQCVNTMGGYNCVCNDGFEDTNPSWPGRTCIALSASSSVPSLLPPITTTQSVYTTSLSTDDSDSETAPITTMIITTPTTQGPITPPEPVASTRNDKQMTSSSGIATTPYISATATTKATDNTTTTRSVMFTTIPLTSTSSTTTNSLVTTTTSNTSKATVASVPSTFTTLTTTKTISISPVISTSSTTNARVTNAVATTITSTPTKAMVTSTIMSPDLTTTIQVISQSVTITVVCNAGYMSVWVARDFLSGKHMSAESLYLGLPECGVNGGNDSHVELVAAWNECDTVLRSNSTHNTAEVTLYNDMSSHTWPDGSVSMPSARLQVPILCSTVMSTGLPPLVTMGQDESTSLSDPWSGSSSSTLPQMPPTPSVTSEPPHNFPCNVPEIVSIKALNITSSSFRVSWTTAPPGPVTFQVMVLQGSGELSSWQTAETEIEEKQLLAGVLYRVCVIPYACGVQGTMVEIRVKTDAQALQAVARLTNVLFTESLLDSESPDYKNLSQSIQAEILQSLPSDIQALVESGKVRVVITGFSQGSVVVNFSIVFVPSEDQDIVGLSHSLMASLQKSSKYAVDSNSTSIQDLNECVSGDVDCSTEAQCVNTMGGYNCVCNDGFEDTNPSWPGRSCIALSASSSVPSLPPPITTTQSVYTTSLSTDDSDSETAPITTMIITTPTTQGPITPPEPVASTPNDKQMTSSSGIATTPYISATATTKATDNTTTTRSVMFTTIPLTSTSSTTTNSLVTTTSSNTSKATVASVPSTFTTLTTTKTISISPVISTSSTTNARVTNAVATTITSTPTKAMVTSTIMSPDLTTTIQVISQSVTITVVCNAGYMSVWVARDFLSGKHMSAESLYLGLPECGVNGGNDSHVELVAAWNECATVLRSNSTHNTAEVTLYNDMSSHTWPDGSVSMPSARLQVPILCSYINSIVISAGYSPHEYDMIKDVVQGSGSFHVRVRLLNGTMPLPENYTLSPDEEVVVEVSVNSTLHQIKVVLNRCWATPTNNPSGPKEYIFLENGCPLPKTYTTVLQNGNDSKALLAIQIFSLVDVDVIYLHCQIQICFKTGESSCRPDCNGIGPLGVSRLSNLVGAEKASCGPFHRLNQEGTVAQRRDTLRMVGFSLLGVGLFLFLLAGVVGFIIYKRRMGTYNFSFKSQPENFTYHVFDT